MLMNWGNNFSSFFLAVRVCRSVSDIFGLQVFCFFVWERPRYGEYMVKCFTFLINACDISIFLFCWPNPSTTLRRKKKGAPKSPEFHPIYIGFVGTGITARFRECSLIGLLCYCSLSIWNSILRCQQLNLIDKSF